MVDLPQPFQKYVYDPSGERVVTYGYAMKNMATSTAAPETSEGPLGTGLTGSDYGIFSSDNSVDSSGLDGAIVRRYLGTAGTVAINNNVYGTGLAAADGSSASNGVLNTSAPLPDSSGSLFCCRTHLTVVVGKDSSTTASSAGQMNVDASIVNRARLEGSTIVPYNAINVVDGSIMIFQLEDGTRSVGIYSAATRSWTQMA